MSARILVTGSSNWADPIISSEALKAGLNLLETPPAKTVVVHGTASAGDALLATEALKLRMATEPHPAGDPAVLGNGADLCLVFPTHGYVVAPGVNPANTSRDTWAGAEMAKNASIPTLVVWGRELYPFGELGLEMLTREANRKGLKLGPAGQLPVLEAWLPF